MLGSEKFGFNSFWWEKLHTPDDVSSCVEALAEIGYKAVEFKAASFDPGRSLEDQFKGAVEAAGKAGLAVSNFVILRDPVSGGVDKAVKDVSVAIQAAASAGVKRLNLPPGGKPQPRPVSDDWWMPLQPDIAEAYNQIHQAFEGYLKVAEKEEVDLVVEPLAGSMVCDAGSTFHFLGQFDSPRLAITFDPSHFLLARDDIPHTIRLLGEKIKHVHVKDAVGRTGAFGLDFLFPILGEGAIDWTGFFRALDDIKYDGYLSAEFEPFKYMSQVLGNDPVEAARLSYRSLVALFGAYEKTK